MPKVYLLKNSGFGIDGQYPKEISTARSALYKSREAVDARSSRRNVRIRYPARLFIDGRCVKDMFTDWFNVLWTNRLVGFNTKLTKEEDVDTKSKSRAYSNETIVDTLESSVFIEDNNASSQTRPAHTNPETRSGTCDELTECKETVDLPESAQQSTSRQKSTSKNNKTTRNDNNETTNYQTSTKSFENRNTRNSEQNVISEHTIGSQCDKNSVGKKKLSVGSQSCKQLTADGDTKQDNVKGRKAGVTN
ncbi:hypothetical protein DPMN_134364 [Dreissena polymorpha]|uniref:Uncharacterized protein n=1 Tax=Dreissena polymorpha TaxID=45954 RepID=A0A9D4FZR7_DREPO|nr:hypothetical protein DPMN_134364 [Dreissena polymorpha]